MEEILFQTNWVKRMRLCPNGEITRIIYKYGHTVSGHCLFSWKRFPCLSTKLWLKARVLFQVSNADCNIETEWRCSNNRALMCDSAFRPQRMSSHTAYQSTSEVVEPRKKLETTALSLITAH